MHSEKNFFFRLIRIMSSVINLIRVERDPTVLSKRDEFALLYVREENVGIRSK